eukprot:11205784-Lingulodinium_polyedra.AAC.1
MAQTARQSKGPTIDPHTSEPGEDLLDLRHPLTGAPREAAPGAPPLRVAGAHAAPVDESCAVVESQI